MPELKIVALDAEDLEIVSAQVQDAVLKVGDIHWRADEKRLLVALNRFVWESALGTRTRTFERRRAVLHLSRVTRVQAQHLSPGKPDAVLELLAVRFTPTDEPSGFVELVFAGGATLRAEVECLEVGLGDLGAAWSTASCPDHGA